MSTTGKYNYWTNGTRSDITESFRIFTTPEADTVIESDRRAETLGSHIKVTAHYRSNLLTYFDAAWQNDSPNAVKFANAHYQFTENEIPVHRSVDGQEFHERLPKPQTFTVLPLLRVFTGRAIREAFVLGQGRRLPVLVPNIKDPSDKVQLLALELSPRSAAHLGQETITLEETEYPADVFNFTGGNYDQTAKFWVAENDVLLKYEWQQNDMFWEVKLTNYVCHPERSAGSLP